MFGRKSRSVEVYTENDLEKLVVNDDYWHNKSVDDAIYNLVAAAIYTIGGLAFLGIAYFLYYYQLGPHKDPAMLIKAATGILLYVSGLVTPTIKSTLSKRRKKS